MQAKIEKCLFYEEKSLVGLTPGSLHNIVDFNQGSEMIIFESILTTFKTSSIL